MPRAKPEARNAHRAINAQHGIGTGAGAETTSAALEPGPDWSPSAQIGQQRDRRAHREVQHPNLMHEQLPAMLPWNVQVPRAAPFTGPSPHHASGRRK